LTQKSLRSNKKNRKMAQKNKLLLSLSKRNGTFALSWNMPAEVIYFILLNVTRTTKNRLQRI
jgi:hypothetical protein